MAPTAGQVFQDALPAAIGTGVVFGLLGYAVASLTSYSKHAGLIALAAAGTGAATSLSASFVASAELNAPSPPAAPVAMTRPTTLPPMINTSTPSVGAELPA